MMRSGDHYDWNPILKRNLKDNELNQYTSLLNLLSGVQIQDGVDKRRWNASKDGSFSITSFFEVINKSDGIGNSMANIWKLKAHQESLSLGGWCFRREFSRWVI